MSTKTASKRKRPCRCIDKMDKLLAAHNTELDTNFVLTVGERSKVKFHQLVRIATKKIDKGIRGKLKSVVPTYCPFCGVKLPSDTESKSCNR